MNPRQRRGVFLLGLAVVGAGAVFLIVARYVAGVRSQVEPLVTVQRLTRAVPAFDPVTPDDVEAIEVPERWAPDHAIRDPGQLVGLVAAVDLPAGSMLQEGMMTPEPGLQSGEREIAILVDAVTGVAGKVTPGAQVDIFATFEIEGIGQCAVVLVPGARVVEVGVPATQQVPTQTGTLSEQSVVPVTFTLPPPDALKVVHAESFANEVRLGLIRPGEAAAEPPGQFCGPGVATPGRGGGGGGE